MVRQTLIFLSLLALSLGTNKQHPPPTEFPRPVLPLVEPVAGLPMPAGLETRVDFWTRIFSEVSSSRTLVCHRDHPEIIYTSIQFEWLASLSGVYGEPELGQIRGRREAEVAANYRRLLMRLDRLEQAPGGFASLSPSDPDYYRLARLRSLFAFLPEPDKFARAAAPGMFLIQHGQADDFERVYRRVRWQLPTLEAVFSREGIPPALTRMAFVESMFQLDAVSSAGAKGLWQLMPETGRQYLTVTEEVDERLDPMISTRAAARLLRVNFKRLGNWPLAVTAYNTGLSRMETAKKELGTGDLAVIIQGFNNRGFGVAGENFYAELLGILNAEQILTRTSELAEDSRFVPPLSLSRPPAAHRQVSLALAQPWVSASLTAPTFDFKRRFFELDL